MSIRHEDVELLLQIARDAVTGSTFQERLYTIGETLSDLIPNSTLSAVVVRPDLSGPAKQGSQHAFLRNAEVEHVLTYAEHYMQHDPGPPIGLAHLGTPFTLSELVPTHRMGADSYTGEFLPRFGIAHTLGMALRMPDQAVLSFCLQRERGTSDFSRRDKDLLRLAAPDLSRAVFGSLLREKLGALSAVDEHESEGRGAGVMILDGHGDVLHADGRALAIERQLEAHFPLDQLVRDAVQLAQAGVDLSATCERIHPLPSGAVLRARATLMQSPPHPRVLVLLELSGQAQASRAARFEQLAAKARLTPREREVAALAIEGHGNQGIAFELGISAATVNVHLGRVYRKTGVQNRTELARLMA